MFELKIMCPEAHIDELSDALEALDSLSVSVEDADAATDAQRRLATQSSHSIVQHGRTGA
jgi:ribosomal protein L11 methyltransferase